MTVYPAALDALVNPTGSSTLDSPNHADQHANANDAIEALQTKVGIDGSADTSSHDYLIAANTTAISANTSAISTKVEGDGVATLTVNTTAPTSPATGDIWVDTDDESDGQVLDTVTYDSAGIAEQVVGLTATQTLTNKTISMADNTLTGVWWEELSLIHI